MHEPKIDNLGLGLLIRLNNSFKYLSFLGGETQRPHSNIHSRSLPVQDCVYTIHLDSKYDGLRGVHPSLGAQSYPAQKAARPTGMNPLAKYRVENFDEILKQ